MLTHCRYHRRPQGIQKGTQLPVRSPFNTTWILIKIWEDLGASNQNVPWSRVPHVHADFVQCLGMYMYIRMLTVHHHSGSVINMSFGGIASQGVKKALQSIFSSAIKEDIQCVGAAGNDNAKTESEPCVLYGVHCVGSINANYHKSGTSNYGSHVSIVAPGDGILSAWGGEGTKRGGRNAQVDALIKQSGTSMAAPHVSGLLASFMSGGERKMSWTDVNYSLSGNQIRGHVGGFPQGLRMGFGNNGINNPNRVGQSFTRGEGKIWQSGIISPAARPTPPTYPAGMTLPIYPAGVLSRVGWPWW